MTEIQTPRAYAPETKQSILNAIMEAAEPVAAVQLVRLPGLSQKVKDVPELLAEDLASARVFSWGVKDRVYWHRDGKAESHERVLKAILEAAEPVPAAALVELPGLVQRVAEKDLAGLLAEDLASGRVFAWGKKDRRYWGRDVRTEARERLMNLASRENLTKEELMSRAGALTPTIDAKDIRAAFAILIKEQQLVNALKPRGGSTPPASVDNVRETADRIFAAVNRIAFSPGTTVTFSRLRQEPELAGLAKNLFDRAVLLLEQDRRAVLTVHGHAAALTDSDREALVRDDAGTYYASIYSR
jgi:hypothetical protein